MPFLVEHSFALSRFMSDKWNGFQYLGDSIVDNKTFSDSNVISLEQINQIALDDLHPKLEKIKNELEYLFLSISLYNNRLKLNPDNTIMSDFIVLLENSLEEIHEPAQMAFSKG